jgi:hypothetical protein
LASAFNARAGGEGVAEYETKITKEADQLSKGDLDLLGHIIRRQLDQEGTDQAERKPDRLLLYVDQWEELYAQAPSSSDKERATKHAADATRFIDLLLTAARTAPVTVVGTVRADFYDPLIGHADIRALLPTPQVLLAQMSRSELQSTIDGPAKKVGLTFDPASLVQPILNEAGEDESVLPLLQYALRESWALRRGSTITAESYARSGGVGEAIRNTAERTFTALSVDDQEAARQLFLRLVIPGEGQEDTRARGEMPTESALQTIVEQFASAQTRLLVTGSNTAGRPTVEIAHEALIRTWPRLRGWIDANREKLRSRAVVVQAKGEWEQNKRRKDLLLPPGFQLARARELLEESGDLNVDDIKQFIAISSARAKRVQRITRGAIAAAGAMILLAIATIGYLQFDKAQQLLRQEIALTHGQANLLAELSATKLLREEFDSALRLASHGTRIDLSLPSDVVKASPAAAALAAAVSAAQWRSVLGHDNAVTSAAFSPDGSRIVTASVDSTARIWDAATGREIAVLRGHDEEVWSAAFSPDGSCIVTASGKNRIFPNGQDNTARIWDAATGREIAVLRGHDQWVHSAAFSPDGLRIVTASADKTARIWDAATAKEIVVLRGMTTRRLPPPSAPTARTSSRHQRTTPPASGTRRPPRRSRSCAMKDG